ncbi:hypothetical protein OY671_009099, partial [Metschnikowia pulcherrima]
TKRPARFHLRGGTPAPPVRTGGPVAGGIPCASCPAPRAAGNRRAQAGNTAARVLPDAPARCACPVPRRSRKGCRSGRCPAVAAQGQQGAPGAEPHQGAGPHGGSGAAARRRRVLVRVPRTAARAQSALDDGQGQRRLPQHRRGQRRHVRQDHRVGHRLLAAGGPAPGPAGHQRRRQVDLHQDHRRRAAIAGGRHPVQQGPVDRLLRPAPGRDAAP